MKKRNYILLIALISGTAIFSSCEKDEEMDMEPKMEEASIAAIASDNENFSILVEALVKTDLASTFAGSGDFTVFAPDNNAFNALFAKLGVSGIEDIPAETLKPILLYHVLAENMPSYKLKEGYYSSMSPSQGRYISMFIDKADGVSINTVANVSSADIKATNGVIHAIDAVLLPPTIVDLAANNGSFTNLVAAVVGAGLAETLSDASGSFTVFAPTDDAFAALGGDLPSDLTPILLYHVLGNPVFSDEISSGTISTINSSDAEIVVEVNQTEVLLNGAARVIATDIVGSNGVIHVIDSVLVP